MNKYHSIMQLTLLFMISFQDDENFGYGLIIYLFDQKAISGGHSWPRRFDEAERSFENFLLRGFEPGPCEVSISQTLRSLSLSHV